MSLDRGIVKMKVKLKLLPIMKIFLFTAFIGFLIVLIDSWFKSLANYEILAQESSWILSDLVHVPQFVIPFLVICYLTKGRLGEFGFNLNESPPDFTHKRMLIIGVSSGLILSLNHVVQILRGAQLDIHRPVTALNVLGYMTFQWMVVGVSEETMFRGLIQTYLMKSLEGTVNIADHEFHVGTIIGAIFWGGFHLINALMMPLEAAIFTAVITTPIGLLMGYAYQQTGSLFTTIIVHNTIFGVPLVVGYVLQAFM